MAKESTLALILGGPKKKGKKDNLMDFDPEAEMDEGHDSDGAFEDAASAALQAIQDNDAEGFASALKDAIEICHEQFEAGEY